ncbi:unnamed protein product [Mytilus edulis]|uniref:Uncharacterized protein n=1 Tax=Mytilus edulis TaxID=6550 RepID=A0A8S3SRU2_MYTED|nr:unnamed protein product [Mytilus edulis]
MTEHKLEKYLKKTFNPPIGPSRLVPVVLSDSKARYLQSECKLSPEIDIKWWFKSGQTSTSGLAWLKDNLASKIGHLDNISLYVWLGTCDFTDYSRCDKIITLKHNPEEAASQLINNLKEFATLLAEYPGCKITFLEIPIFSIYIWNRLHDHPDPNRFKADDNTLIKQILVVNDQIRALNNDHSSRSPSFSADIYHPISCNSKNTHRHGRDLYNFNLYLDGIHPKSALARVWLRKLAHRIKLDCW